MQGLYQGKESRAREFREKKKRGVLSMLIFTFLLLLPFN